MAKHDRLVVSGAREHNLKDVTVSLPRDALTVITGLSGSGKSSLAFDTIYAEGQRRYVESLSAYARQFLGQMDKPDVDSIEGLSLINRAQLAWVGDQDPATLLLQIASDPRAMAPCFHHHQRSGIAATQSTQRDPLVANTSFLHHPTRVIHHTKPVPAIAQVQSYRDITALRFLLHRLRVYRNAQRTVLSAFSFKSG